MPVAGCSGSLPGCDWQSLAKNFQSFQSFQAGQAFDILLMFLHGHQSKDLQGDHINREKWRDLELSVSGHRQVRPAAQGIGLCQRLCMPVKHMVDAGKVQPKLPSPLSTP
jgi:hypothetical protein